MIISRRPSQEHRLALISAFKKKFLPPTSHRADIVCMRRRNTIRLSAEFNRGVHEQKRLFMAIGRMLTNETDRSARCSAHAFILRARVGKMFKETERHPWRIMAKTSFSRKGHETLVWQTGVGKS